MYLDQSLKFQNTNKLWQSLIKKWVRTKAVTFCRFETLQLSHVVIWIAVAAAIAIVPGNLAFLSNFRDFNSLFSALTFIARVARLGGGFCFFLQNFAALFLDGGNGGFNVGVFESFVVIDAFENVFVEPNLKIYFETILER